MSESVPAFPTPLTRALKFGLPALLCAAFVAGCVAVTQVRCYWTDEAATVLAVGDLNFSDMWALLQDQFNLNPPVYFVAIWAWAKVFGYAELSLRLFSAFCVAGAFLCTYRALRYSTGFWPALLGAGVAFVFSPDVLFHTAEARCYALTLLLGAALFWMYQRLMREEIPSWRILALNALLHAALVLTHYVCFFYSGIFLAAGLLEDARRKRLRWRVAASVLAGWLCFVPWIPTFLNHTRMASQDFWIDPPQPRELFKFWLSAEYLFPVLGALLVLAVVARCFPKAAREVAPTDSTPNFDPPIRLGLGLLVLVPLAIYLYSQVRAPIFVPRYLVPSTLGWAIACAWVLNYFWKARATEPEQAPRSALVLVALLSAALFCTPAWYAEFLFQRSPWRTLSPEEKPGVQIAAQFPDVPVACDDIRWLAHWYYTPERENFVLLCDEASALRPEAGRNGLFYLKLCRAIGRHRTSPPVVEWEDYAPLYARFLVFGEGALYKVRLKDDPRYRCTQYGNYVLVERRD